MRHLLAATLFATLLAAPAARADKTEPHPCRYDRHRFCYNAEPGQMRACLARHYKDLTPACKQELDGGRRK